MNNLIYESGCICPELRCPYHPTPNRPFDPLAEGTARDFYESSETARGPFSWAPDDQVEILQAEVEMMNERYR